MLEGTTAFVTGASRGIGREIAVRFAEEGANVALAARSTGEPEETACEIDGPDSTLVARTDVSDEASVKNSVEEASDEFGGIDCLVNNAGIAGHVEPFDRIDAEDWDRVQEVNLRGLSCAQNTQPTTCVRATVRA